MDMEEPVIRVLEHSELQEAAEQDDRNHGSLRMMTGKYPRNVLNHQGHTFAKDTNNLSMNEHEQQYARMNELNTKEETTYLSKKPPAIHKY